MDKDGNPAILFVGAWSKELHVPSGGLSGIAGRAAESPDQKLLALCQTTYEAAAIPGQWDRTSLERSGEVPHAGETGAVERAQASDEMIFTRE